MLKILETKGKLQMSDLAKELDTSMALVENWIKFLVEERIVGIEYKFTTPYIYKIDKNTNKVPKAKVVEKSLAKETNNSFNKKPLRWDEGVEKILLAKKDFFYSEASTRGLEDKDNLWEMYKKRVYNEFKS